MKIRTTSIVIDESKLIRAVSAHLSAAQLALNATDESFEIPLITVFIEIDEDEREFYIKHVLTDNFTVTGVVLEEPLISENEESLNQLRYAFVRVEEGKIECLQLTATILERLAVNDKATVTSEAMKMLLD